MNKIKIEPQGAEDNMDVEENMNAEDNIDAKDNMNDEDSEHSDTETEFETEFKESPKGNAMIRDVIFGHLRRRNAVDDDLKRPSILWDAWRKKPKEERAKGRKPLGYLHGDIAYTYEEWEEAKRQRMMANTGLLYALIGLPR
jgi:hypothetical protein